MLSKPEGPLSAMVQAVWSASVPKRQPEPLIKPLYADAGSGIIFNLAGEIIIGDETLPEGIVMLPVKKTAENMVLRSGAMLAGVRFLPAMGYGILKKHYAKPTLLTQQGAQLYQLNKLYAELKKISRNADQVQALYGWANKHLDFTNLIPDSMERALESVAQVETLNELSRHAHRSQRHIERQFKQWLGMTPKHYQRVLRIKKAVNFLRENKHAKLSDVAHRFGFSDQAHMTREFKTIAYITPSQV